MHFKLLLALGSLFLSKVSLGQDTSKPEAGSSPFSAETGRYIVKFSQAGTAKFRTPDGSTDTSLFFSTLADTGKEAQPALSLNSGIFHGASFDLKNNSASSVAEIEALPEVEKVWSAALVSSAVTGAAVVQSEFPRWTPHNETGVAAIHSRGNLGKGSVVAIIDTGIDYNHPALGGGFGPGFKVEAGYDLVGDDYVLGGPYIPDSDPKDCNGHGTHVAGIIGSTDEHVPGVAPEARLRIYKVFGCDGATYEDVIVAGFLQAYEEGADIISASLGSDRGFDDTALAVAATTIQAAGVFVSIAAGNSGANGPFFSSSGGNGHGSMAVGAAQEGETVGFSVIAHSSSGDSKRLIYLSDSLTQWKRNGTFPAAWYPDTRNIDACNIWENPAVPNDAVLVLPRADCDVGWQLMDTNLMDKANWVFFYNFNGSDWERPSRAVYDERQPEGFALIAYEDGDWLVTQHENNYTITFEFVNDNDPASVTLSGWFGARISDYSSWGPTLDTRMKPEISAPGTNIFSTWPLNLGTWATHSGTSMATPYLSGVAALFFASQGGRAALGPGGALLAHERIIASGNPLRHNDGTGNLASVAQQGAGLVDAVKVVQYETIVSPANLDLNDTDHFQATHDIKVTNSGKDTVTYKFYHEAGITIHTKNNADAWIALAPPYSSGEGDVATASFSDADLTLAPGASGTFSVTFTEPSDINPSMLPVYGGSVNIVGSQGEAVRVTYMGVKGSMYASQTWEMQRGVPLMLSGYGGEVEEGHNYTFENDDPVPQPYFNVLWSTKELSCDFVDRYWNETDWAYPPVPGQNKLAGFITTEPSGLDNRVVKFPVYNYPRNGNGVYVVPSSKFTDDEEIPIGEYRLMCRNLRTFGDPRNIYDWQYKLTPWFRITREKGPAPSDTQTSTTTATVTTATSSPTSPPEPCRTSSTPITLQAQIGSEIALYNLYRYSDFLSIDGAGTHTPLNFSLGDEGYVSSWNGAQDLYLSVHTNNNSLIYMYKPLQVTGAFSYLNCTATNGKLECQSNAKSALYVCDTSSRVLRHGVAPLDGCQNVTLYVGAREIPTCDNATTSATATFTTLATAVRRVPLPLS